MLQDVLHLQKDIEYLNIAFLRLLRDASRIDTAIAVDRFGVSLGMAQRLAVSTLADIEALAAAPCLLFAPRNGPALENAFATILAGADSARVSTMLLSMHLAAAESGQ